MRRFAAWSQQYLAADEEARRALLVEGAALAKGHREGMKALILRDPKRALELAVPMVTRQKLPDEILRMLEERISGVGALEVLAVSPDSDPSEPVVRHIARIGDREWRSYVYGRRSNEMSKERTMMNGIAVDRIMAVGESPVRPLEIGEVPDRGKEIVEKCPVSGLSTGIEREPGEEFPPVTEETPAVEAGDQIIFLCDGGHIRQLTAEILAEEGATGGPSAPTGALPLTRKNSTGLRRHLYMRVVFPDRLDEFQTDPEAWVSCRQLDEYFKEISYGKLAFQGTVTPTLVLPRTEAWYKNDYATTGSNSPIMNDAKEAARQLGYSPEDFHHYVVIYMNGPGSFGGLGSVNGTNTWLRTTSVGTFRHEIGHNIGVWHSNFWNTGGASVIGPGQNQEYGHTNDVMGSSGSGGHFNASMKEQLEWITPQTYHTVTTGGLYRIHQFDQVAQDPGSRYALKVAKDADRDYWVEFRQKLTTNPWFTNGVSINWSPWGGNGDTTNLGSNRGTHLLDLHPGSADDRNDSPLVIGRTFSDYEADVHITPVAKGGTVPESIDVRVHVGTAAGNAPPTLTIQPSATSISPGGNITFTAVASDPDGDPLAYHWNFGDKLSSFNGPSFSTNNSAAQTKTFASTGWYAVQCTASDMKGGVVRRTVLVQVGTPATHYLGGIVTDGSGGPLFDVRVHNGLTGSSYRGAQTDSEGRYFITNLASGSVTLSASAPGKILAPSGFTNPVTVGPSLADRHFSGSDGVLVRMEPVSLTASEGGAAASWRFVRTGSTGAALPVYVDLTGSAGTGDYALSPAADTTTALPLELFTIPAGQSELVVTLSAVQDTTEEGPEIVLVSLVNAGATYLPTGPQTLQIVIGDDDTTRPRVSLTVADDEAAESAGGDPATFLVSRTGSTASPLTVNFTLDSVTPANAVAPFATPVLDFAAIGTSVVIPAGQSTVPVLIAPVDDDLAEGMELVKMNLGSNAAYILDSVNQGTVKINDNDLATVTLAATDTTATEGADSARFTLTRVGDPSQALTVHYSTGGDALLGTDYSALPGFITFAPGQSSVVVDILPVDDSRGEPTQTVVLQLRSAAAYRISGTGNASVSILDNGDLPAVSVFAMDGDVAEPGDSGQFRIVTTGTGSGNITVNYQISGTAQAGADFNSLSGSVTMGKNTTSNLGVTVIDDSLAEDAETIVLTLLPGVGYELDPAQSATLVIADDDAVNMVSVSASTLGVTEGATVNLHFSRSGSTASELVLPFSLGGSAVAGSDYTAPGGTATIPAGSAGTNVSVATINDTLAEGIETLVVDITPDGGNPRTYGLEVPGVTVTLQDNDTGFTNTLRFTQSKHVFGEGDGTVAVPVTRSGSGSSTTTCSVEYTVRYSTAEGGGVDYRLTGGRLEFLPGELSKSLPLQWTDDNLPENVEALVLQLRNPAGATLASGGGLATVFLLDNEPRAKIEAVDPFAHESGDTAVFRIWREGSTAAALAVPLSVTGTAVAGVDYVALPQGVTIPAGSSSITLTLTPIANPGTRGPLDLVVSLDPPGEDTALPHRRAVARIGDAQSDNPPMVHLSSPAGEAPGVPLGSILRLVARAQDDNPGNLVTTWTKVSGPGTVTFEDASSPSTGAGFSLAGSYLLRMTASDGGQSSNVEVRVAVGGTVTPWMESSLGAPGYAGTSASQRGFTALGAAGSSFTGSSETAFFRHRPLQGDGEIVARVRNLFRTSDSARVGVMMRESTVNNVRFAGMFMAPSASYGGSANRSSYLRRTGVGSSLSTSDADGPSPAWWVRVTRAGNVFTSYDSPDGVNWTQRGQDTLSVSSSALAGIALTSANSSDIMLAQVDRIRVTGAVENVGPLVDVTPPAGSAESGVPFQLSATASDDGFPADPGTMTLSWIFVSGPEAPVFENPNLASTRVTFPRAGVYRLRLEANDGEVATGETIEVQAGSGSAEVTLSQLNQVYDGTSRVVLASTTPPGLAVAITYNGVSGAPVDAGTYAVEAVIVEPGYNGSTTGTLVVAKASQNLLFDPIADQPATASVELDAVGGASGNPVVFSVAEGPSTISGSNLLIFQGAGLVRIVASQAGGPNHLAAIPQERSFNVSKVPAVVSLSNLDQLYDGTPRSVTVTTSPPGLSHATTYGGQAGPPTEVGTYPVLATVTDPRYEGSALGDLQIRKTPAQILLSGLERTYDGSAQAVTATTDPPGLPVTITYSGLPGAPATPGTYPVSATINHPYFIGSASGSLVIAKAPQIINFPVPDVQYVTETVTLAATGGESGNPVVFEVIEGPGVIENGNRLRFEGDGDISVSARQDGNENYLPAAPAFASFSVRRSPADLSLQGLQQVYDGTPRVVTATTEPEGLLVRIYYNGSLQPPVVPGTYEVFADIHDTRYEGGLLTSLVVSKAPQNIDFPPIEDQPADAELTLSATGGGSEHPVTFEIDEGPGWITGGNRLRFTGAGTVRVRARQAGDAFHNEAVPVIRDFEVTRVPATVSLSGLEGIYDGLPRSVVVTTDPPGLETGLLYGGSPEPPADAGTYAVEATIVDPRYAGGAGGTLTIAKAPQVIVFPPIPEQSATATVTLGAAGGGSGNPVVYQASDPGRIGENRLSFVGAGEVLVTASQAGNANYHPAVDVSQVVRVRKAQAGSLVVSNLHRVYDGTPREVDVATEPEGMAVVLTYDGETVAPTGTGRYEVIATIDDPVHEGTATAFLVVDDPARLDRVGGGGLVAAEGGDPLEVATFAMGRYEVTWGLWRLVRDWAADHGYDLAGLGAGCADDHPVRWVTWVEAVKWCNARTEWENMQSGLSVEPAYRLGGQVFRSGTPAGIGEIVCDRSTSGYRLPVAEEREFAARGGHLSEAYAYPGGSDPLLLAWHEANSSGAPCDLGGGKGTRAAGGLAPNELGLYDLSGNVAEWTESPVPGQAAFRFVAGGAWDSATGDLLPAVFAPAEPGQKSDRIGFRVVRSVAEALAAAADGENHAWDSGGSMPWFSQLGVSDDGIDAAASGLHSPGAENWVETSAEGPGNFTFRWKIRVPAGSGSLSVEVGGEERARISDDSGWLSGTVYLPAGTHRIRWIFRRHEPGTSPPGVFTGPAGSWLDQVLFTPATVPQVVTGGFTAITEASATGSGEIEDDGGAPVLERGFVFSNTGTPELGAATSFPAPVDDLEVFSVTLSQLNPGTTYRARAYARNEAGTGYGDEVVFTTDESLALTQGLADRDREIEVGGVHVFHFQLTGPRVVRIGVTGEAGIHAELLDGSGRRLALFEGTGPVALRQVLAGGRHTLRLWRPADPTAGPLGYSLSVDAATVAVTRPDVAVGPAPTRLTGTRVYAPVAQMSSILSNRAVPVTGYVSFANRGDLPDSLAGRVIGGNVFFAWACIAPNGNVTASLKSGTYRTPRLDPGSAPVMLRMNITPNRARLTRRIGSRTVTVSQTHNFVFRVNPVGSTTGGDSATLQVRTR